MVWRCPAVATLGLVSWTMLGIAPANAHDPIRFDTRRATPGASIELIEVAPATGEAPVKYRLRVSGLPPGQVYGVWTNEFGHGFHEQASGFRLDESGTLVSSELDVAGRPRRLDQMTFEPGPLPRGAGWQVAIVSSDRRVTAFAKAIPRPIAATHGPCTVSLELASRRGDRFIASGSGFMPGEDVTSELTYAGRTGRKTHRVSPEGRFLSDFIVHGGRGGDQRAPYSVACRAW